MKLSKFLNFLILVFIFFLCGCKTDNKNILKEKYQDLKLLLIENDNRINFENGYISFINDGSNNAIYFNYSDWSEDWYKLNSFIWFKPSGSSYISFNPYYFPQHIYCYDIIKEYIENGKVLNLYTSNGKSLDNQGLVYQSRYEELMNNATDIIAYFDNQLQEKYSFSLRLK